MALKTDYKADVFEGNRKYQIIQDGEGIRNTGRDRI